MSQLKTMQDQSVLSWLPQLKPGAGPRFLQIADALQQAVTDGLLKPGNRLPPQRELAAQLNVD
jgi:DNA-binding GntR family transcriptional regulator